jgi:hypothetical protein
MTNDKAQMPNEDISGSKVQMKNRQFNFGLWALTLLWVFALFKLWI